MPTCPQVQVWTTKSVFCKLLLSENGPLNFSLINWHSELCIHLVCGRCHGDDSSQRFKLELQPLQNSCWSWRCTCYKNRFLDFQLMQFFVSAHKLFMNKLEYWIQTQWMTSDDSSLCENSTLLPSAATFFPALLPSFQFLWLIQREHTFDSSPHTPVTHAHTNQSL